MEWYWYLVIALVVVVVIVLIGLFGNERLKKLAYELVCNAETIVGSGNGKEKYSLVLDHLVELTKGIVPKSFLEKMIEWAVKKMKAMLLESPESVQNRLSKPSETEE